MPEYPPAVSPLATVIIAWAAVYAYVCAYYCILSSRRRSARVYLAFGLLAGALSVYAVGAALVADAEVVEEAVFGMRLKLLGLAPGVAFAVDFCHQVAGRGRARMITASYVWASLALVVTALGLTVHPQEPAPIPTWGFASAPDYAEPALTSVGQLYLMSAWPLVAYGLLLLAPHVRHDRDVRLILLSMIANVAAGGHDIFVHAASLRSVYLLEHGAMLSIVAMSYLLLDRFVRTSEQLTVRTLELRSSYDELRHTQEELVRKEQLAAVGELSAVIAHEVRNPLAVIKNSVSGLRRTTARREDRDTLLGILDEEIDRLSRLVDDLLAYARPVAPQGRDVPLDELVRRAVQISSGSAQRAGGAPVEVEIQLAADPESVHGDPDLLRNAFVNVIDNAFQAMSVGGTLRIVTRASVVDERAAARIDFVDTGEGMEPSVRDKARDPFFTTRPTGTGLGLAIVERVVRTHGGTVEIESTRGEGTRVSLLLPVGPRPLPAHAHGLGSALAKVGA